MFVCLLIYCHIQIRKFTRQMKFLSKNSISCGAFSELLKTCFLFGNCLPLTAITPQTVWPNITASKHVLKVSGSFNLRLELKAYFSFCTLIFGFFILGLFLLHLTLYVFLWAYFDITFNLWAYSNESISNPERGYAEMSPESWSVCRSR